MNETGAPVPDEVTISCHLHHVPDFVERELVATYDMLHSSLQFFRVWRSMEGVSCYVARCRGRVTDILLFSCGRRQAVVLNEMIDIAPDSLERFAAYVFAHFPSIDVIRFNAVNTTAAAIGFPVQRHNAKDTFVIALPATPDEYLAAMGKSTRATLRSRLNNIRKNVPGFAVKFLVGDGIDEETVRHIARLSEQRIDARGVKLRHDVERIMALSRECGLVTVLLIDGRMCAGSVNYRIGASLFGEIVAHDPAYDRLGVGGLCLYHTICESIRTGIRKFYLGGGRFVFKERMLGQRIDMDQLQIYRSRQRLLANLDLAADAFVHGQVRRLKRNLYERKGTWMADLVFKLFHAYKTKAGK